MKKMIPQILIALCLSACAGPMTAGPQGSNLEIRQEAQRQQELVYKRRIEDQDHLYRVAFPILGANAGYCGSSNIPSIGMTAWNIDTVPPAYRNAAQSVYNLGSRLAVQSIASKSPAKRAGILSGDVIVAINGQEIPAGRNALETAARLMKSAGARDTSILVERDGKLIEKNVSPVIICAFPALLDDSSDVNAYADGQKIVVSKGILRFTENDNELALVIAHELGHSAMRHVDKLKQNAMTGSIGGLVLDSIFAAGGVGTGGQFAQIGGQIGAQQNSVAFEQEADYVGMYFMERAGYDASGVADFWRRMAAEGQSSITNRTTHPTSPERFIAIERTYDEIAAKKSRGQQLAPNIR